VKRKLLLLVAMFLAVGLIIHPYHGQALSDIEKIDNELKSLKEDMDRAQHQQRYAKKSVQELTGKKQASKEDLEAIIGRIDQIQQKLDTTQSNIAMAEEKLLRTGEELEEAIKQLNNRKELMDSRIRMAYTSGPVSYLDVLFNAASFSDFLDRFNTVESIAAQDRNIAQEHQNYSESVAQKKEQRGQELNQVKKLYTRLQTQKTELQQQELDKEVMIANLDKKIESLEEISEEAEKQLTEFVKKASALEAKKKRIKNYYKGGKLGMPLKADYRLSSPFGYRNHPISGKNKLHGGLDMAAPKGTAVYAAESGVVLGARWMNDYGNAIVIDHGGDLSTLYGHLSAIHVKEGETVKRGEKIGLVGSTGVSTGNHLHFEVRKKYERVNPEPYLK
jgi:murein DD-endopeptidase MepM/ murein hydrolase activator NlpD